MKISFKKDGKSGHNLLGFCIVEGMPNDITLILERFALSDERIKPSPGWNPDELDVVMTMNGKEVDIIRVFDHIEKQLDIMIEKKAKDLIGEKLGESYYDHVEKVVALQDQIENILRKKIGDLGEKPDDEW